MEYIKNNVSIVDVVQDYVNLKKRGANYIALCPFHSEKTPSFTVSPTKQIFYCFGCGKGGNVFKFVMDIEGVPFNEAVKIIAKKNGITITQDTYKSTKYEKEKATILTILKKSKDIYHREIFSLKGKVAIDYLKSRYVNDNTIAEFELGYAPGGSYIVKAMQSLGFKDESIEKAGVATIYNSSNIRDYFVNRLIIPIRDISGNTIAFGGRSLDGKEPKYLNTRESMVFKKRESLFNLSKALAYVEKLGYWIVVEGYFDVIELYQGGFKNVVAPLGTAITIQHINKMIKYSKKLYLAMDSDRAGQKSIIRAFPNIINARANAFVVELEEEKDPADFVLEYGLDEFNKRISKALPIIDFVVRYYVLQIKSSDIMNRESIFNDIWEMLKEIKYPTFVNDFIDILSQESNYDRELLLNEFKNYAASRIRRSTYLKNIQKSDSKKQLPIYIRNMLSLISKLITFPDYINRIKAFIDMDEIGDETIKSIFGYIFKNGKNIDIKEIHNIMGDKADYIEHLAGLLIQDETLAHEDASEFIKAAIKGIKVEYLQNKINTINSKIKGMIASNIKGSELKLLIEDKQYYESELDRYKVEEVVL